MPVEHKDVERFFCVGAVLILHTDPNRKNGPRHKTVLRGWRKGTHMLLDRPRTDTGMFVALQEGQPCVFRFLFEGLACAFDAMILDWDTRRHHPYLRVQWPQEVQFLPFRKFERVKTRAEAVLNYEDGTRSLGEVRDLSQGGCGVFTTSRPPDRVGRVSLSLTLPDGVRLDSVKALVRNVRPGTEGYFLGCEYDKGQEDVKNDISFYVTTCLSREKGLERRSHSVVIIDHDTTNSGRIRKNLERQSIDVFQATNTIDGLCRLRTVGPEVVLVNTAMNDLPGAEICRLVTACKDFENVKVYLYGGDAPAGANNGAAGYFPNSTTMAPDIAFAVAKQLRDTR